MIRSFAAASRTALFLGSECRSCAAFASSTVGRGSLSTSASTWTTPSSSSSSSASSPPSEPPEKPPPTEADLEDAIRRALPGSEEVVVRDTSGGCGTMYEITVAAREFAGMTKVSQHRLVAAALPVKDWHGFVLHTSEAR